jgi:Uma2 family endonuclease
LYHDEHRVFDGDYRLAAMILLLGNEIRIPVEFENLEEFRNWSKSDEYPQQGDVFYFRGDLWVDLPMETALHNQIKGQINAVLILLTARLGRYFDDRMRLVNLHADISGEPDGMFFSHKTHKAGRVKLEQGAESLEVIGSPDMVLEVVRRRSIKKDTELLRELYYLAGISEYWLVNPLGDRIAFDILQLTPEGYVEQRKTSGWVRSRVFGKSFRLIRRKTSQDVPEFRLLVK